jgi:hypothetical protein
MWSANSLARSSPRLVTPHYEPMITREFLLGEPTLCAPIDLPDAWERSGHYPTEYCIRTYQKTLTVSLEKFVYRAGVASGTHRM